MMIWDLPIVDPVLSIGISLLVLWNVSRNLKKVFAVILQTAPDSFDSEAFERGVLAIEGIRSVHHVHCWSIDGESHVLSAHLILEEGVADPGAIKCLVRDLVDDTEFEHITLETERLDDSCPQREGGS